MILLQEKIKKARAKRNAELSEKKAGSSSDTIKGSARDLFGDNKLGVRGHTEEGYRIYGEGDLKLGMKGGDTPDCPFDCNCCF